MMKQLGNLALVCAKRNDLTFVMLRGQVNVIVRSGESSYDTLTVAWDNDETIRAIIHEMNFGKYAEKA